MSCARSLPATKLEVLFGSTPAAIEYQGLAPSFTGLYQVNIVVPNVPANNTTALSLNLGGVAGRQTLYNAAGKWGFRGNVNAIPG